MLASISPLGERARGNRWGLTAGSYALGSLVAAAGVGGALGAAGHALGAASGRSLVALAAVAALAGAVDLASPGRLPTARRQVDEEWLGRYRGWVYGLGFGAQLGLGVVTIVTTATVYAWWAAAALAGSALGGAAVGASFGVARALPLAAMVGVQTPAGLRGVLRRLTSWAFRARVATVAVSAAVGAGALAVRAWGR